MKKFFIFAMFIIAYSINVSAQTYCYKYLYTIDKETGVKSKDLMEHRVFYTFNNGKNNCYKSDEKGIKVKFEDPRPRIPGHWTTGWNEYKKISVNSGIITYQATIFRHWYEFLGPEKTEEESRYYLLFSADYTRLNSYFVSAYHGESNKVKVYEKVAMPGQEAPPSQMW